MRKYLLGLSILVCLATVLGVGFKVHATHQAATKTATTRTASILKLSSSPFAPAVKTSATPAKTLLAAGSASTQSAIAQEYGKLPLAFEPNVGQTDAQAKYLARGDGYTLFLTSNEAVLSLVGKTTKHKPDHPAPRMKGHHSKTKKMHRPTSAQSGHAGVLRMELADANASPIITAQDQLPGITNYFIGTSDNWHTNVPTYREVSEQGVYPGIDLVYYGSQHQLEYDFVVAPGADPRAIHLSIDGASKLSTSAQGDLMVAMQGGEVSFRKPVAYQWKNGEKQIVASNYKLGNKHDVMFALGNYDATQPLVIDPILAYSTYLGGSNIDGANSIALASDNTAFIAGGTSSTDFPTAHALQPNDGGSFDFPQDAFVTKFSADGSTLLYSTYLGGKNDDVANSIAVDTAGDAYVVGTTDSPNFPVTFGSVNALCGSDGECGASLNSNGLLVENGFIVKLNPAGSAIIYGAFIGQYETVQALGVAVDANQIAYITGSVTPYIIPTSVSSTTTGYSLASATENAAGTQATFTTTAANELALNQYVTIVGFENTAFNGAYFIVRIASPTSFVVNLATTASTTATGGGTAEVMPGPLPFCSDPLAAQPFYGGGATDAYVVKISATGNSLLYCSFLGGSAEDSGQAIAADGSSNAYVTGLTYSTDFPTTAGAFQGAYGGAGDAFLTETNTNPSTQIPFTYSTYVGGIDLDQGNGIALYQPTPGGPYFAYIAGGTSSTGLGSAGAFQANCTLDPQSNCEGDAFVAEFNTASSGAASELFFTYLGGSLNDSASGVALDLTGDVYITGSTVSTDFVPPTLAATAFQPVYGGGNDDSFVAKFDPTGATLLYASYLGGSNTDNGYGIAVDTSGSAYVAGQTCSLDFPLANPEQPVSGGDCDAFISKISILNGIEVNPAGLTFPAQSLNTTSDAESVTITNGDSTTTISSIALTGTNTGDFNETNNCPGSLTPGQQCSITVTFTPTASGLRKAAVTIMDSAPGNTNQVVVIDLTGSTSTLTLSASTLNFGNQAVGVASAAQSLTATNDGTTTLAFSSITASGDYSETDNCSVALQPGTNCTINVVFTPSAAGSSVGALTLTDNAPGSPQIVQLTGTGVTLTPSFTIQSAPPSATIRAGQSATYTLYLTAVNGFNSPVQLSASGVPTAANLTVSSNPVTPGSSSAPAQVTLTVSTTARTMVPGAPITNPAKPLRPIVFTLLLWLACLMAAGIAVSTMTGKLQGQRATAALVFAVMLIMLSAACNGGSASGVPPGTPAGNYQITITGTSTGATNATVLDLQVN